MYKTALFVGFIFSALPVMARLDDNENECIRRYGEPVTAYYRKNGERTFDRNYKLGDFLIQSKFIDGIVVEVRYALYANVQRSTLLDAEIQAILDAEKGTGTWKPVSQSMTQVLVQTSSKTWVNTNGAKATYNGRTIITLISGTAETKREALKAEEERKATKSIPKF